MAPLRAHISHLLETQNSPRKISYWYGARSLQELFYKEYFEALARKHANFTFQVALSDPLPGDRWNSFTGYIHDVVRSEYLNRHPDPNQVEYYLCGPPAMIQAARIMLADFGVVPSQIVFDEF